MIKIVFTSKEKVTDTLIFDIKYTIIMAIYEKKVELIELFYDLIFVYAISKLTALISEPVSGTIPLSSFFVYLITSFVILQAWLYFTNYVNRYGQWKWFDYALAIVNMIAVIYMANTITTHWDGMLVPFNISMLVMLLTVLGLYLIQYKNQDNNSAALNSIQILSIVCTIYVIALVAILLNLSSYVIWIDVVAVITGAFLPFFLKGNFDKSIINFPHLVERFELLTIITFGEAVVGMTHFFDVTSFNPMPILVFIIVLSMFGAYVIQIHNLMNHHRVERSLRLMFSHYFVIISINLMTVAFELLHSGEVNPILESCLIIVSLVIFYTSIMANRPYYNDEVKFLKNDAIKMILLTLIGALIILIFMDNVYLFLAGVLVITLANFSILAAIQKKYLKD